LAKKKWKGDPKRYQSKEWRKGFGMNPKTGTAFKPFMVAIKNNKRPNRPIKIRLWRGRKNV
tara:strand:+ start:7120 stop:7302 length:183 start_codon:yes stop_codon:yes gene_type:complete